MDKVVVFADHSIGYKLVEQLLLFERENRDFKIIKVFTNYNPNAFWLNIKDLFKLNNQNCFSYYEGESSLQDLYNLDVDYLLLLSWKYIVPSKLINHVKKNVVNLHYSLLPKHRGVYPVNWTIASGDEFGGVTFHLVNSEIDAGPIIIQSKIKILITDDSYSLMNKLDDLAFECFNKIWNKRNQWNKICVEQVGSSNYNNYKSFSKLTQFDLNEKMTFKQFINRINASTFLENLNATFIDTNTQKKFSIKLIINELDE